uniref:Nicotinate phosphoribosyltransferase n=1 Tax=Zonotrichia albicollis TaxID=44394 RepID=A0A8D2N9M1_ZONAL
MWHEIGVGWGWECRRELKWDGWGMEHSTCSRTPGTLDDATGCANPIFPHSWHLDDAMGCANPMFPHSWHLNDAMGCANPVFPCQELPPRAGGDPVDLADLAVSWLQRVCDLLQTPPSKANQGELAAFVSYAVTFPCDFQGLLDTYCVRRSGLPNFCAVALALHQLGYQAIGVRLDSGDLAQQSKEIRGVFQACGAHFQVPWFETIPIAVSNDISEQSLEEFRREGSEIDMIGIGTHLVTCPLQPSLGCVYKLVEVNGSPCLKLTEDEEKMTIPGMKAIYRLYDAAGESGDPSQGPGGISCSIIPSLMSSWQVTPSWTSWPWRRSRRPARGRSWGSESWGGWRRAPRSFPALWSPSIAPTSGMARSGVLPSPGGLLFQAGGWIQGQWWLLRCAKTLVPTQTRWLGWWLPTWIFPRGSPSLQVCEPLPSLPEVRTHAQVSLNLLSPAHRRLHEPQPYPVAVTERLHQLFLELRQGSL